MGLMLGVLGKIPAVAWVLAAVLAWGGWNGYRAKAVRAEFQAAKEAAALEQERSKAEAATETARRLRVHQEVTDAEITRRRAAEAVAARLRSADERLRAHLAAAAASAASHPAAPGGGQTATSDPGVLADVLGECSSRVRALAAEADATRAAGNACERSYDALIR